jgi:hypothetical protein
MMMAMSLTVTVFAAVIVQVGIAPKAIMSVPSLG